jgi:threonine synthase
VLRALRATGGTAVAVTDADLLASTRQVARAEGTWVCPESAACFAAAGTLRAADWLADGEEVVVLNTGAGLKYPQAAPANLPVITPGGQLPPDR